MIREDRMEVLRLKLGCASQICLISTKYWLFKSEKFSLYMHEALQGHKEADILNVLGMHVSRFSLHKVNLYYSIVYVIIC